MQHTLLCSTEVDHSSQCKFYFMRPPMLPNLILNQSRGPQLGVVSIKNEPMCQKNSTKSLAMEEKQQMIPQVPNQSVDECLNSGCLVVCFILVWKGRPKYISAVMYYTKHVTIVCVDHLLLSIVQKQHFVIFSVNKSRKSFFIIMHFEIYLTGFSGESITSHTKKNAGIRNMYIHFYAVLKPLRIFHSFILDCNLRHSLSLKIKIWHLVDSFLFKTII